MTLPLTSPFTSATNVTKTQLDQLVTGINTIYTSVLAAWTAYTPVLRNATTHATMTSSAASGRYLLSGKTVNCWGQITSTNTSTQGVEMTLPLSARDRLLAAGVLNANSVVSGTPNGIAEVAAALDAIVLVTAAAGFIQVNAGCVLSWSLTYEVP